MPRWRRSASRRAPSGSARSMRSACEILRDAGAPIGPARRPGGGPARSRAVGRRDGAGRAGRRRLAAEARARRDRRRGRRRSRRRARSPGPSSTTRRPSRRGAGSTSTTSSSRAIERLETRPCPARSLARAVRPPARRRGPGRRPGAAPARAAPGRAGEPDLPRRRRRPVDLRLAPGRRPAGPGPRRGPARPRPGRSRGQLPLPGPGRGARRPAGRAQPRAVRQADRRRPGGDRDASFSLRTPIDESDPARAVRWPLWPDDDSTRAVLARTNRELLPAVVVAMAAGIPFRAARLELPLEDAARRRLAGGRAATEAGQASRSS